MNYMQAETILFVITALLYFFSAALYMLFFTLKKEKMGSDSKWVNMWEALIIYFVYDNIVEPNFEGKYVKKAIPYFATLFFFVLFCNLLGLLPGMSTATGSPPSASSPWV